MAVTSRAGMYTQTQALSYWQVRWSGVAGHIDWAARKDERLDERVLFGEQLCFIVKIGKEVSGYAHGEKQFFLNRWDQNSSG